MGKPKAFRAFDFSVRPSPNLKIPFWGEDLVGLEGFSGTGDWDFDVCFKILTRVK